MVDIKCRELTVIYKGTRPPEKNIVNTKYNITAFLALKLRLDNAYAAGMVTTIFKAVPATTYNIVLA